MSATDKQLAKKTAPEHMPWIHNKSSLTSKPTANKRQNNIMVWNFIVLNKQMGLKEIAGVS